MQQEHPKKKMKKNASEVPVGLPITVLKFPIWREGWTPPGNSSTMKEIKHLPKLQFLTRCFKDGLTQSRILFHAIPQFYDDYFGTYRFLVVQKQNKHDQKPEFCVLPNVVFGQRTKDLCFLAPNRKWFELQPGKGRSNEVHIPAPFS